MTAKDNDSDALRARRSRAHKKGDHSLCVPGRCSNLGGTIKPAPTPRAKRTPPPVPPPSAGWPPAPAVDLGDDDGAGRIARITREFVATLPYAQGDPRYLLGQLAIELGQRIDNEGAVPAAIGQLRQLLMQLAEAPNGPPGVVDELRVKHHQRQLDSKLVMLSSTS